MQDVFTRTDNAGNCAQIVSFDVPASEVHFTGVGSEKWKGYVKEFGHGM